MTLPDSEGPEFHKWAWLSRGARLPSPYEIGVVELKVRDYWDRKRQRMREWNRGAEKNTCSQTRFRLEGTGHGLPVRVRSRGSA